MKRKTGDRRQNTGDSSQEKGKDGNILLRHSFVGQVGKMEYWKNGRTRIHLPSLYELWRGKEDRMGKRILDARSWRLDAKTTRENMLRWGERIGNSIDRR